MRNQQETMHTDAPRFSRSQVPVIGILISLVTGLIFYTTLMFANYTIGGPGLRGNLHSRLTLPLPATLMLLGAMMMLALGIRKMQRNQRPWYTQQPILLGIGFLVATLGALIIGEGLGNDLVSPLIGWSLAVLFVVLTGICMLSSIILASSLPPPKEADKE